MYILRIYTFYNFCLSVIKLIDGLNYALANVKVKLLQVKRNRGSILLRMGKTAAISINSTSVNMNLNALKYNLNISKNYV